jgi:dihydroxy-acid dehydratase
VHSGDVVTLDVPRRLLRLEVDDEILAARRAKWAPPPLPDRGWLRLYIEHVLQADKGADLDFLVGGSGAHVARDSH